MSHPVNPQRPSYSSLTVPGGAWANGLSEREILLLLYQEFQAFKSEVNRRLDALEKNARDEGSWSIGTRANFRLVAWFVGIPLFAYIISQWR